MPTADFSRGAGYGCCAAIAVAPRAADGDLCRQRPIGPSVRWSGAQEAGRRVPRRSIGARFDNIPEAATCHPALTTIDQFIDRMGYVATEMLVALIQGQYLEGDGTRCPLNSWSEILAGPSQPTAERAGV